MCDHNVYFCTLPFHHSSLHVTVTDIPFCLASPWRYKHCSRCHSELQVCIMQLFVRHWNHTCTSRLRSNECIMWVTILKINIWIEDHACLPRLRPDEKYTPCVLCTIEVCVTCVFTQVAAIFMITFLDIDYCVAAFVVQTFTMFVMSNPRRQEFADGRVLLFAVHCPHIVDSRVHDSLLQPHSSTWDLLMEMFAHSCCSRQVFLANVVLEIK